MLTLNKRFHKQKKTSKKEGIEENLITAFFTIKVVYAHFCWLVFLSLIESTCQISKNVFYFTSKAHSVIKKINFRTLHFHDLMTSSSAYYTFAE